MSGGAVQDLAAPQLAGALAALVAGESVSRPSISAAYEPSQAVCDAIEALEEEREQLYDLQMQADIAAPLSVDLRLSGGPLTQHLSPKMCINVYLSERSEAQKTSCTDIMGKIALDWWHQCPQRCVQEVWGVVRYTLGMGMNG